MRCSIGYAAVIGNIEIKNSFKSFLRYYCGIQRFMVWFVCNIWMESRESDAAKIIRRRGDPRGFETE